MLDGQGTENKYPLFGNKKLFSITGVALVVLLSFSGGAGIGYFWGHEKQAQATLTEANEVVADKAMPMDVAADGLDSGLNEEAVVSGGVGGLGEFTSFPAPKLLTSSFNLEKDDNLYQRLIKEGVSAGLVLQWIELAKPVYDLSKVKPGQQIKLLLTDTNEFLRFDYNIDKDKSLVIVRGAEGYQVAVEPRTPEAAGNPSDQDKPDGSARPAVPESGPRVYKGTIQNNFYNAAKAAGVPSKTIMQMIELFVWEVDFSHALQRGDEFEILVGPAPEQGDKADPDKILAAMIQTNHKPHFAFYFKDGNNKGQYYNEAGNGVKKFMLKMPVKGCRISSVFTAHRYHPILHQYLPHLAVDLVGPAGTKVYAPGDGKVLDMGRDNGLGNFIKIKHTNNYTTTFGHLMKFAPGLHKGSSVKQDQLIGYIGSTGLSTGPHLHYVVAKDGSPINPLKFKGADGAPVNNAKGFKTEKERLTAELNSSPVISANTGDSSQ